jgi:hypothetical protein
MRFTMAKLTKPIFGVVSGEVYPTELQAGTDCPPELLDAARAFGAVDENKAMKKAPEVK